LNTYFKIPDNDTDSYLKYGHRPSSTLVGGGWSVCLHITSRQPAYGHLVRWTICVRLWGCVFCVWIISAHIELKRLLLVTA